MSIFHAALRMAVENGMQGWVIGDRTEVVECAGRHDVCQQRTVFCPDVLTGEKHIFLVSATGLMSTGLVLRDRAS